MDYCCHALHEHSLQGQKLCRVDWLEILLFRVEYISVSLIEITLFLKFKITRTLMREVRQLFDLLKSR
jgi:hypothetical protein